MSLLGFDAVGRPSVGQISNPTPALVPPSWFAPLSQPVRAKLGERPGNQQFLALDPLPRVSFGWLEPLSEPVRKKPGLNSPLQHAFEYQPAPSPFVATGWFALLSEPQRSRPRNPAALPLFFAWQPSPAPFAITAWFAPMSEPVRFKPGLKPALQQAYAAPDQLRPNPAISGVLMALETPDVFLGGASVWNAVVSGEIGVSESRSTGAEIGVSVPQIAGGRVAITIV